MFVTESERLFYRWLEPADFEDLKTMLADARVMYAWEHTFSDEQIADWLQKQEECYRQDGVGYFAAVDKASGDIIGQIGLHRFTLHGQTAFEVCYMLKYSYFHQGFALEGAKAMTDYAFSKLGVSAVYAQVKTDNTASMNVAERAGFVQDSVFVKRYNGKDMPHFLCIKKKM